MRWMRILGSDATFSLMKGTSKTFFTFQPCSHTAQCTSLTFQPLNKCTWKKKNQNPFQFETWEIKSEHNSRGKGRENQQPLALFALCLVECLHEITWSFIQLILRAVHDEICSLCHDYWNWQDVFRRRIFTYLTLLFVSIWEVMIQAKRALL